LDDGTNPPSVFEMDIFGDGVLPGNVQVDTSAIADDDKAALATAIANAINGVGAGLTVTALAVGAKVGLTADTPDAAHNVLITQSPASAQFELAGMSGGFDAVAQVDIVSIIADERRRRWYLTHV
jgi:hypothetical protein